LAWASAAGDPLGTLFESLLSLHVVVGRIIGVLFALAARRLGSGRMATTAAVVAILATIGAIVPALAVVRTAHRYGAPISWSEHLRITAPGPYTAPNQTLPYAAIDGKNLYVDIYLPRKPVNGLSAPVLMMHPADTIHRERSMGVDWDRWLAER
jgi:hypothetical protein